MKYQKITLLIIIFVIIFQASQVYADQGPYPTDYAIITDDKKYIFVMLIPDEEIMRYWEFSGKEPTHYQTYIFNTELSKITIPQLRDAKQKTHSLRTKYPCSGLFLNNGSTTPIWTVNWYSFYVYLYPDAEHLIRIGPWSQAENIISEKFGNDGLAYAFYKNGVEVAKYLVNEIVKNTNAMQLPVRHNIWGEDFFVDETTGFFHVETIDNQEYTYDIREMAKSITGKETSCTPNYKFSPYARYKEYAPAIVGVIVLLAVLLLSLRRRNVKLRVVR